eukprot:Mrub_04423.p1 GENE.Mrub_04423~~Mrub_04423.p1  ORF type:complete len:418 (+),score=1.47 Mrub_04423:74-1255(+)
MIDYLCSPPLSVSYSKCIQNIPTDVNMRPLDYIHLVTVCFTFAYYIASKHNVSPKYKWNLFNFIAVLTHIISGVVEYTLGIAALLIPQKHLIYICYPYGIAALLHGMSTIYLTPNTYGDKYIAMTNYYTLALIRNLYAVIILINPYYRSAYYFCFGWLNLFMYLRVTYNWLIISGYKGDRYILSMMMSLYCCMYASYWFLYPLYLVGVIWTAWKLNYDKSDDFSLNTRVLLNNDNYTLSTLSENENLMLMLKRLEENPSLRSDQNYMDEFMYEYIKGDDYSVTVSKIIDFYLEQGIYINEIRGFLKKYGIESDDYEREVAIDEFRKLRESYNWTFELTLMNNIKMLTTLLDESDDKNTISPILADRYSKRISKRFESVKASQVFSDKLKFLLK